LTAKKNFAKIQRNKRGENLMKMSSSDLVLKSLLMGLVVVAALPDFASAAGLDTITNSLKTNTTGFFNGISLLSYAGGSALGLKGIFKLKAHIENPGSTPVMQGVGPLAGSGALFGLPVILKSSGELFGTGSAPTYSSFNGWGS
jgi:hypothetical protein